MTLVFAMNCAKKPTFVLIHGAWADEHAWDAAKPALEKKGFKVITVNLPGHGGDTTPISSISLDSYVKAVENVINKEEGKVILVGHSMAGIVVTQVAENIPSKIEKLIYVAAYLPKDGEDLLSIAKTDSESKVGPNLEFTPDFSAASIKKEIIPEAICADCPDQIKEILVKYHKAEPTKPMGEKVKISPDKFGKVEKHYISTTKDFAVSYSLQQKMLQDVQFKSIQTMETSHLPFLVKADEFVNILTSR